MTARAARVVALMALLPGGQSARRARVRSQLSRRGGRDAELARDVDEDRGEDDHARLRRKEARHGWLRVGLSAKESGGGSAGREAPARANGQVRDPVVSAPVALP
jgi:hypothetical protein